MTLRFWLINLLNYSWQIAAVITIGSLATRALRIRRPGVLLAYRHLLLAVCFLLPLSQPWRHAAISSSVEVTASILTAMIFRTAPSLWRFTWEQAAACLLSAGILARLCMVAIGLVRLRRYRRSAQLLDPPPGAFGTLMTRLGVRASVYLSPEISGPVTFGFRRPVILLPLEFRTAAAGARTAIACHELIHVRRCDWAMAMIEELVHAVFWFHPAIWCLLAREQYVDALLAAATGRWQPDLASAPLFLRRAHLAERIDLILQEVSMSKRRLFSSLAVLAGALFLTARFAVMTFPISAPAQEVARGGDHLLHHAPIVYPTEAIEKRIEGTVIVSATIDDHGSVTDARVVSGPDALRRAALRSVLDWHYGADTPSPVEVAIDFHLPVKGQTATSPSQLPAPSFQPGVVKYVRYAGVSSAIRDEVARRLAVREGDPYAADTLDRARQSARDVDEHLVVSSMRLMPPSDPSEYLLTVSYASANTPQRIRVGGNVQDAQVINKVKPPYPPQAKAARIQGVVKLNVLIGRDGTVENVELVSGPPELVQVAMDAVRQWTYKPTLLNGNPVEVATVVDINFTLAQ